MSEENFDAKQFWTLPYTERSALAKTMSETQMRAALLEIAISEPDIFSKCYTKLFVPRRRSDLESTI